MDEKHRKLIKSYASYFFKELYKYGTDYELEDLEGEFNVCYAKALKMYDPSSSSAKFETYLISAITNRFYDIRDKTITASKAKGYCYSTMEQPQSPEEFTSSKELVGVVSDVASKVLSTREYAIFNELVAPSEKVSNMISHTDSNRSKIQQLHVAIASAYGMTLPEVKRRIRLLRNKLKSNLDLSSFEHCFAN